MFATLNWSKKLDSDPQFVPLFEKIATLINKETGLLYGVPVSMDFARLDFAFDKEKAGIDYAAPAF